MTGRVRVVHQGTTFIVLGVTAISAAATHLPAEVDHWHGSFMDMFARRKSGWVAVFREPPGTTPKDARPGVMFTGCRDATGIPLTGRRLLEIRLEGA